MQQASTSFWTLFAVTICDEYNRYTTGTSTYMYVCTYVCMFVGKVIMNIWNTMYI